MRTVVGAFPSMGEAERVAHELEEIGIANGDISVVAGNDAGRHDEYVKKPVSTGVAAASAASFGGGVGIVAGLIALAIPGVGPIIAGGALATVLTGLGVGAAAGGLIGAFTNMGVSHEEAPLYEEAVRRGGVVVAVHVNDPMEGDVERVMEEHGARDLNAEADAWRASGWKGAYSNPHPYPADSEVKAHFRETEIIPDEPVIARKSPVRSYPYQRTTTQASGRSEAAGNREAAYALVPPEAGATNQSGSEHFPVRTGPVHISDDDPAYVFGNRWASDPNYYGQNWTDVESGLRSNWDALGTGPWDMYRDRVRAGFEAGTEDPDAPRAPENKPGQRGF